MLKRALAALAAGCFCASAHAQTQSPKLLDQSDQVESIYAPPEILTEEKGTNEGGVNIDLKFSYMSDYVWRGIDRSESGGAEDAANLQFDGALKFDLGRFPHLFLGSFFNVYDSDPASRFQEIRPYVGFELTARPFILTVGHSNYIFPDRDKFNTAEVWSQLKLDDSYFFRTDDPIFNPYIFVAWDYDKNDGIYAEFGLSHDIAFEEIPLTLTPKAAVAYVDNNNAFRAPGGPTTDPGFAVGTSGPGSGFQHYELGLELTYRLNELFRIPNRYGQLDFKGYLFYTDGIDNKLRADTQLWGGAGIGFSY